MSTIEFKEMEIIRKTVAGYFGIALYNLNQRKRTEPLATIRHIAMMLCAELTCAVRSTIGSMFSRDHSNVTHSILAVKRILETEHHWALNFFEVSRLCKVALGRPPTPPAAINRAVAFLPGPPRAVAVQPELEAA